MNLVVLSRTTLTWVMLMEIKGFSFYFTNHGQFSEKVNDSLDRSIYEDAPREKRQTAVHTSDHLRGEQGLAGLGSRVNAQHPTSHPNHRNAKGFWNHFLFRRRSRFQSVLPIQNNEVHALKCRAIPFWQKVVHDDCEPQLLKNNVCFGKCDTSRTSDDSTACLLCSPAELIPKAVRLQCKDNTEVIKDVKIVEDCQCKEHIGRNINSRGGPALIDPSVGN